MPGRKEYTPSKKHLARLERERRQTRMIYIAAGIVLLLVFGSIGYGILNQKVLQPHQPVARVGADKITTREFQAQVRYNRRQLIYQYNNLAQSMQYFGSDPSIQAYFQNQLSQVQVQLDDPTTLGGQVLNTMIDNLIIRHEAQNRGITVTSEEIDQAIREAFGYYPDGQPTPTVIPTTMPTSTFSPEQLAIVTLTPTPTEVPTATPDANVAPTETLVAGGVPTPTLGPEPTATAYTQDAFQADYQLVLDDLLNNYQVTEVDVRRIFEDRLYRQKLLDVLAADLSHTQDQVWARHILLPDETTANDIYQRLQNGEDWATLAAENSLDNSNKDQGGDLGWFPLGTMVKEFEQVVFNLPIGKISQPVHSQFGWHIIQVLGHEERPLTQTEYDQLRQQQLQTWLEKARLDADIQRFDYWVDRVPTDPALSSAPGAHTP